MFPSIMSQQMSLSTTLTKHSNLTKIYSINIIRSLCTSIGITENPIVELPGLGTLQGCTTKSAFTNRKIYQFLGIRYAESPVGERRFKAPIPVEPWDGILKVEKYGQPSPTYRNIVKLSNDEVTEKLEDCLTLCVYSNDLGGKRPVMVYIHGGGFVEGSANQYRSNFLLEKDIVLVVPQYRLGPLGFLSTKSETLPGNASLLDVILSLEWVQKYIRNFGGDPDRVTIAGQSAGAGIVSALSYSPQVAENLFHKVILQSGSSMATWLWDDNPEKNSRDILNRAGFDDACKMSVSDVNKCFMEMDVLTLLQAFNEHVIVGTANGVNAVGGNRLTIGEPTNLLPKTPYEIRRSCEYRRNLPMLAGVVKNDASFGIATIYDYLQATHGFKDTNFNSYNLIDFATRIMGCEEVTGGLSGLASHLYFTPEQILKGNFREMANGLFDFTNTTIIKGPVFRAVQANAQFNAENTYLYTFDYKGEHTRFTGNFGDPSLYPFNSGVAHSDDNIYLYPNSKINLNSEDIKIAERMVNLWTSFVIDAKPTSSDMNVSWPPMTNVVGPYLHINNHCTIGNNFTDEFTVLSREANELRFCQKSQNKIDEMDESYYYKRQLPENN